MAVSSMGAGVVVRWAGESACEWAVVPGGIEGAGGIERPGNDEYHDAPDHLMTGGAANLYPVTGPVRLSEREDRNVLETPSSLQIRSQHVEPFHGTTILTVRHQGHVAMGGDGQVTLGSTVMKADASKIRRLNEGAVLCGFAGATADAFALLERFEGKLKDYPANLPRAATELAKEWRTDRALRRLEALLSVADADNVLLISGTGDVIQPTDGIIGIGSGGQFALAAARALTHACPQLAAKEIVRQSMAIAAEIDVYTNDQITVEEIACRN